MHKQGKRNPIYHAWNKGYATIGITYKIQENLLPYSSMRQHLQLPSAKVQDYDGNKNRSVLTPMSEQVAQASVNLEASISRFFVAIVHSAMTLRTLLISNISLKPLVTMSECQTQKESRLISDAISAKFHAMAATNQSLQVVQ